MAHDCAITHELREAQKNVFRVAMDPRRHGLTMKAIEAFSGLPYETLRTYASGNAIMPLSALCKLCGVLPTELLSVLLPGEFRIVETHPDINHASLAAKASDFTMSYVAARDPGSECGSDIGPGEAADLAGKAANLTT